MASKEAKRSARRRSRSSSLSRERSVKTATAPDQGTLRAAERRDRAHQWNHLAGGVREGYLDLRMGLAISEHVLDEPAEERRQVLDAAASQALRRASRQLLGRLVEHADAPARAHGDHATLDGRQRLLQLLVHLQHALVSLRVPDGHRRLMGERLEQIGIIAEVGTARSLRSGHDQPEQTSLLEKGRDDIGVEASHFIEGINSAIDARQLIPEDESPRVLR